jgi:threonine synthase
VDGISLLARTEGIFTETAGGVTVATLRKLANAGVVKPEERTVALITGDGLKTIEAVADRARPTFTIAPRLDEFAARLKEAP